jgi:hypothetical protein
MSIDPRIDMRPDIDKQVLEYCQQYHSGLISLPVFLASLDGYRRFGYHPLDLALEHSPDPPQPTVEGVRLEQSRRWLEERMKR